MVWKPSNVCEYFFFDDTGCLVINEQMVKSLQNEFSNLMKQIYNNAAKKYEDIIK